MARHSNPCAASARVMVFACIGVMLHLMAHLLTPAFGYEGADVIAVAALGGSATFYLDASLLASTWPGNKMATIKAAPDGIKYLNTVSEETLRLIVQCVSTSNSIESVLNRAKLTPEQMVKVIDAAIDLGLDKVRDAAFKDYAGTISPIHVGTATYTVPVATQISNDGHSIQNKHNEYVCAIGRFGCAVGETLRVKFMIETPTLTHDVAAGFAPYLNGNHTYSNGAWVQNAVFWGAAGGGAIHNAAWSNVSGGKPFYRGDVAEIEYNNKDGGVKFFLNGVLVGGGVVPGLSKNVKLYPMVWMMGPVSVRMEIVEPFKVPANVGELVRQTRELI